MRARHVVFAASGVAVILLAAAVAVRLKFLREPAHPLEPNWDAFVVTIAGGAAAGSSPASPYRVRFSDPFGIAATPDGTIFVADGVGAHRIYRISPDGAASIVAGSEEGFADGPASRARFSAPSGLSVDSAGNLYVADTGNNAIRRISPNGTVSTLAGADSGLNGPVGIAVASSGRVLVADTYNDRIVAIEPDGTVTPLAGSGTPAFEDGSNAAFDTPTGLSVDPDGKVYVADTGNGAVRVITPAGTVSTIAGHGADGPFRPFALAFSGGSVFVADERGRVREIMPNGMQRTVAGRERGFADGTGVEARFRAPSGIAAIAPGRLVLTDRGNAVVRLVAARSQLELRPPGPPMSPHFDVHAIDRSPLLWPFAPFEGPFEITGTLGEPRGPAGDERFHAGLDVHSPEGTVVHIVRDGAAADPLGVSDVGSLNESVRIGPIAYIHLRVGRDARDRPFPDDRFVFTLDAAGELTRVRLKRGASFSAGEAIGTVNRFYHAHLNLGWPGEELNPLRFGPIGFRDTVPPVIARRGVRIFGEDGRELTRRERRRLVVDGRVRIVVDAWDQADGNLPRRRLGLYRLGYQVLDASGVPLDGFEPPLETIRFDRHPADDEAARIIYASGSGIPVYGSRSTRFLYVVTSRLQGGVAVDDTLDTSALAPGDYTVRILAADFAGNEAVQNRDLPITVSHEAHATGR